MDLKKIITSTAKNTAEKTVLDPIKGMVDENLREVVTTIGSFIVRSVRGKFQRSITLTIGYTYSDYWMEEALYGILYKYNDIKSMSRLELKNSHSSSDGSGLYYQLDNGTHNLKYRDYNILLCIETSIPPASNSGRIRPQKLYTIITYNLSDDFVKSFENDMILHRNSLLRIKKDSPTVAIYKDYHESDGYTYWEKIHSVPKRKLATVYLPMEQKKRIVKSINEFFASKKFYNDHGIAHNLKILLYGPPGPQPVSEKIILASGTKTTIGDLKAGDYVLSYSGSITKVEEIYEYEEKEEIYNVVLDDGRSVKCTVDHKLPIVENDKIINVSINDIINSDRYNPNSELVTDLYLPETRPVIYKLLNDKNKIDGWVVGYIYASMKFIDIDNISMYDQNKNVLELKIFKNEDRIFIQRAADVLGWIKIIGPYCYYFKDNNGDFINKNYLIDLGIFEVSVDDHLVISSKYLLSNITTRMDILRGIMDAKGDIYQLNTNPLNNDSIIMRLDNELNMNDEILELIRTLGYAAVYEKRYDQDNEDEEEIIKFKYYDDISMSNLFKFSKYRLKILNNCITKEFNFIQESRKQKIVAIYRLGITEKVRCIHISDPTHIYLSGEGLIPVCNSGKDSIAKMIASEWNRNIYYITGGKEGKFVPNAIVDEDDDISYPLMLISDIDKYPFLVNEPDIDMDDATVKEERIKQKQVFGSMINALDGVLSGEDRIIVMTTNHIEKFSETLLRDGRIDIKEEIGYVTPEVFRKYCHDFYKYDLPPDIELADKELTVAKLQTDVVFRKLTVEEFIDKHVAKSIKKKDV